MKKKIALLLCLCMILAMFAACGQTAGTADESAESGAEMEEPAEESSGSGSGDVIRHRRIRASDGSERRGGEYELRGVELANEQYPHRAWEERGGL